MNKLPFVLVTGCTKRLGARDWSSVKQEYLRPIFDFGMQPLIVAANTPASHISNLLSIASALLVTGSVSSVEPKHYGHALEDLDMPTDPCRDQYIFPLIRKAIELDLPVFAICRGIQEMNVALGGSLYQDLDKVNVPIGMDWESNCKLNTDSFLTARQDQNRPISISYKKTSHRDIPTLAEIKSDPLGSEMRKFSHSHPIMVKKGGLLSQIWQEVVPDEVNSIHFQGIRELAPSLRIEARAEDGLIESVSGDASFCLAVQWHPEADPYYQRKESQQLFFHFAEAVYRKAGIDFSSIQRQYQHLESNILSFEAKNQPIIE